MKLMKKIYSLLCLVCIFVTMVMFSFAVSPINHAYAQSNGSGDYSYSGIIAVLKKYGFNDDGITRYWTYRPGVDSSTSYKASGLARNGNTVYGYDFPDRYGQCWAFANLIGYELSGIIPNGDVVKWKKFTSLNELENNGGIRVGDIIRSCGHSGVVMSISEDGDMRFVQCAGDEGNAVTINAKFRGHYTQNGRNIYMANFEKNKIQDVIPFWGSDPNGTCGFVLRSPYNTGEQVVLDNTAPEFYEQWTSLYAEYAWYKGKNDGKKHYVCNKPYAKSTNSTSQSVVQHLTVLPSIGQKYYTTETMMIYGAVKNAAGNIWYKVKTGGGQEGYIYSGDVEYVCCKATAEMQGNWNLPEGDIAKTNFPLRGTIKASNRIQRIEGQLRKTGYKTHTTEGWQDVALTTPEVVQPQVQYFSANDSRYSYELANSVIDRISFGRLEENTFYSFDLKVYCFANNDNDSQLSYNISTQFYVKGSGSPLSGLPESGTATSIAQQTGTSTQATTYTVVTSDGLNVRSSPNTKVNNIVTTLWPGMTIVVTEKTSAEGKTWGYGTTSNGYAGWCVVDNNWTTKGTTTVTDTDSPVISLISISDISDQGYTVKCSVTDNTGIGRVAFPTWTLQNGQDDLPANWDNVMLGTVNNGIATYRVNTSDHNYEGGCYYRTHVYAWDTFGNQAMLDLGDVYVPEEIVRATSASFDVSSVILGLGESKTLELTVNPSNTTERDILWLSTNPSIVSFENNVITAKSIGTATVSARISQEVYARCYVTVKDLNKASLAVRPGNYYNNYWTKFELDYAKPIDYCCLTVKTQAGDIAWVANSDSSNFLNEGNRLPTGTYTAFIEIENTDGETLFSDPIQFSVTGDPVAITEIDVDCIRTIDNMNYSKMVIEQEASGLIIASLKPVDANDWDKLIWSSSNEAIVSIGEDMTTNHQYPTIRLYGRSVGIATITAKTIDGRLSDSLDVKVIKSFRDIALQSVSMTMKVGESKTLVTDLIPANATAGSITWSSSDTSIASVKPDKSQEFATITGIKPGTVQIRVTGGNFWGHTIYRSDGTPVLEICEVNVIEKGVSEVSSEEFEEMLKPDFVLPYSLKIIEKEAFAGLLMSVVKCPDGLEIIKEDAFRGCSKLKQIYIPKSVNMIKNDVFQGCADGFTIFGYADSFAETFADVYGYAFVSITDE